jgi:hypothetical protein
MDVATLVDRVTMAVAALVVSVAAMVAGLFDWLLFAGPLVQPLVSAVPFDAATVTTALFVGAPLVLSVVLLARAVTTRTPADVVLAAFAVPCLLAATWALSGALSPDPGVSVRGVVSLGAGTVLAVAVLSDVVLARVTNPPRGRYRWGLS